MVDVYTFPGAAGATVPSSGGQGAVPVGAGSSQLTGSPYGIAIPIMSGDVVLQGVPLWSGQIRGGVTGRPTVSFALAFGRPCASSLGAILKKLTINGTVVFDTTVDPIIQQDGLSFRFYPGSGDQLPDPAIAADRGAGNAPGFRDLIYIVVDSFPIGWTGGTFPVVVAEITQIANKAHKVKLFNPASRTINGTGTTNRRYIGMHVDFATQRLYCYGDHENFNLEVIDIFDLAHLTYIATVPVTGVRFDWALARPHGSSQYLFMSYAGATNTGPISLVDRTTGATLSQTSDDQVFSAYLIQGQGADAIDEFAISGGLVFGGLATYSRKGTQIAVHDLGDTVKISAGEWAECPGRNVNDQPLTGRSGLPTDTDAKAAPADTSRFSLFYVGSINTGIKRVLLTAAGGSISDPVYQASDLPAPDSMVPVLNRMEAVWTTLTGNAGITPIWPTSGSVGKYLRKQYTLYMGQHVALVASQPDLTVQGLWTGPADNPYLAYITQDSISTFSFHLYSTPWNARLTDPQAAAFATATPDGTEYTIPTAAALASEYGLVRTVVIPTMQSTSQPQLYAWRNKEPGQDVIGYRDYANNLILLNVATGDYKSYPQSAATWALADGTVLPNFDYNAASIFLPTENIGIFCQSVSNVPSVDVPGVYNLLGSVDTSYDLQTCITDLCAEAGMDTSLLEFDGGIDEIMIKGALINQPVKLVDVLGQICALFRISIVESSGKIKFIARLTDTITSTRDLAEDDLAFIDQNNKDDGNLLDSPRQSASSLPSILFLNFLDFDNNCLVNTQAAKRIKYPAPSTQSVASLTLSVPVVMDSATAALWTTRALYDMWSGQLQPKFRLGQDNLDVEPGDYITVTRDTGRQYLLQVQKTTLNQDFSVSLETATVAEHVLANSPAAAVAPKLTASVAKAQRFTGYFIHNMLLFPTDTVDASGNLPTYWTATQACTLYLAQSGAYTKIAELTAAPTIATAATVLTAVDSSVVNQIDSTSFLAVTFPTDSPSFPFVDTDAAWQGGQNAMLVGNNDIGFEVVYYRNFFLNSLGQYVFYNLIRGQRGTEYVAGKHALGDAVIFISNALVLPQLPLPADTIGADVTLLAVPIGADASDPSLPSVTFINHGGPLLPLAPVNITVVRDVSGATNNLTITWNARARTTGVLHDDDGNQPLDDPEKFLITILSDDATQVVRLINTAAETANYSASAQTADGFATTKTTMRIRVQQYSDNVGYGYPGERTCRISST